MYRMSFFAKPLTHVYNMGRCVGLGFFPFLHMKYKWLCTNYLFLLKQNLLNKWDVHQNVVWKDNRSSL